MAGVAAWGGENTKWTIHEKEANLLAGIWDVKVSSTVQTDTYHVSKYDPTQESGNATVTQWYETGPDLVRDNSPHWHEYNSSVHITESNDLCTVAVIANGSMSVWCDDYSKLPYYFSIPVPNQPATQIIFPGPGVQEIELPTGIDFTEYFGGNLSVIEDIDSTEIRAVLSTRSAFALLTESGKVAAWGDDGSGGKAPELTNVVQLFANRAAFAALLDNGTVVSWGDPQYGGATPPLHNMLTVFATQGAFAALTTSMHVVAWGAPEFGGLIRGIFELQPDTRSCPPTYTPSSNYSQCERASAYLGKPAPKHISNPSYPSGCWLNMTEDTVYYNDNSVHVPCMWERWDGVSLRGQWFREEESLRAEDCKEICCSDTRCSSTTHVYEFNNYNPSGVCRFYETEEMFTPTTTLTVTESMSPTVSLTASPKPSRTWTPSFTLTKTVTPTLPPTRTVTLTPTPTVTATITPFTTPTRTTTLTQPTPTVTTTPTIEVIYQHNVTYTSFVKVNEIQLICTADPRSVGHIVMEGVRGVVATSKSFMAVTGEKVAVWPHSNESVALKGVEDIDPDVNSVFGAEDAFLVVDKGWRVTTLWAPGGEGGTFWTEKLTPLDAQFEGKVLDIRTTRGAAAIVSEAGTVDAWKTKPDSLNRFVSLSNVACFWLPVNENKWVMYREQTTALECATICLNTPGCTGFEYPTRGSYCAPWLDWECTNISSPGWHYLTWGTDDYELYLLKDHVFDGYLNSSEAFYFVGKGNCTEGGEGMDAERVLGSTDQYHCRDLCAVDQNCASYVVTENLECILYKGVADGAADAGDGKMCYSRRPKSVEPSGMSGLSIGAVIFVNHEGDQETVVPVNETADGWFIPRSSIKMPNPKMYYLVTSTNLPQYDVVRWMMTKTTPNSTMPIHILNWYNYFVPTSRETSYGPFVLSTAIGTESVYIRPLRGRGKLWYETVPNAACPEIEKLVWNETTSFVVQAETPEKCSEVCQLIKSPGNCTSFAFWNGTTKCRLYFNDDCSYPKVNRLDGVGWVPQEGVDLYTLSVVDKKDVFDTTDYGQTAPTNLTMVEFVRPSREAFSAVNNGTAVAWGGILYGGDTKYLEVGKPKYLESGVDQVIPGIRSFSVRRTGDGHDECEITPCYAFKADEYKVPSQRKPNEDMDQICFDPHPESWSPNDFICVCTEVAYEAVGKAVECPAPPSLLMWPWLLLALPLIGGICMRLDIIHVEKLEIYRRTITFWDMYALHATGEEERALEDMLVANPGSELPLLRTLVPHTEVRGIEAKMFLLFQRRLGADAVRKLPMDLILLAQTFIYGPERIRAPYHRPMTPFGHVISSASTVRESLSPRRLRSKPNKDREGSSEWAPELITPLVCDDESSLTVTVL
eukprot:TRINITY_DN5830_c0_g1_i1.p1 TRINITY_DN5830_c0_g1~~TRINITY_DN5830_c0_g1_i1.p1  ORF type:complete len:1477 (+),score=385.42 TRINITY_DN5830_c0_g1_i1:309-4433(+)